MLIAFPLTAAKIVGTDIFQAAVLLAIAGAGQLAVGHVDLAATGWLYGTDEFWGDRTVERIHVALAWAIVVLSVVHVAGVVVTGVVHGENLVAAMLHGRKREPAADDVI